MLQLLNDELKVTVFLSIDSASFSVDFKVFTNSLLSLKIHFFKMTLSIALSACASSDVFSKSVRPGHSLQSWRNYLSEVDCKT
jgi:hypothetical protein